MGEAAVRMHDFQSACDSQPGRAKAFGVRLSESHRHGGAARRGGTYYLTYHRYATRNQVESCYPQFAEFLRLKKKYDPEERFQSDWYRHYRTMFANSI